MVDDIETKRSEYIMPQITYKLLVEYLNKELKIKQTEIANALNVDKSTISRLLNQDKELGTGITNDYFLDQLLRPEIADEKDLMNLLKYLKKQDTTNREIDDAFNKCLTNIRSKSNLANDEIRKALKIIVDQAERSRNGKKTDDYEEIVTFAPCKYRLVEHFVGREQLIQSIDDTLYKYGLAIICGMGGLGKSQSALYYAEKSKENGSCKDFQMVFFNKDLSTTLLDITFIGLKIYQERKQDSEEERVRTRLEILEKFKKDTLLIIDNMDVELTSKDKEILKLLSNMEVKILITTRNTRLYASQCLIKIEPLPVEDQIKVFLLNYSPEKIDIKFHNDRLEEYKKIFQMVSGHTMLIELIAKIMREYSMTTKKIIKVLSEGRGAEDLKVDIEKDNNYEQEDIYHSVSALFNISNMEPMARQILINLSLSSISGIKMSFFDDYLLDGMNIGRITALIHQSWIIRDAATLPDEDRIHLHPLIKTAVIRNLKPSLQECKLYIESAIKAYSIDDGDVDVLDRSDICSIIINAGEMFSEQYDADSVELLIRQAELVHKSSHYSEAYRQCELALQICQKDIDSCKKYLPRAFRLQADIAVNLARYQEAIENYIKAIEIWDKDVKPPYEYIAMAYNKLANVYRKNSEYTQALDNFRLAEHRLDVNGVDNPALRADIFNNIGIVYINLDNLEKALENYIKAKNIREKQEPINKKQLAYSYHNIGTVYQRQGKVNDALEWHQKALDLRMEVYMPNDPVIADSLTMIGNDYVELVRNGENDKYEIAFEKIIAGKKIRENALGPDHPATAWSYESMGKNYFYQGMYKEAEECFHKCLDIRRKRLEPNHAYTAEALEWIGKTYKESNDLCNAIRYLKMACDIQGVSKPSAQKKTAELIDELEIELKTI